MLHCYFLIRQEGWEMAVALSAHWCPGPTELARAAIAHNLMQCEKVVCSLHCPRLGEKSHLGQEYFTERRVVGSKLIVFFYENYWKFPHRASTSRMSFPWDNPILVGFLCLCFSSLNSHYSDFWKTLFDSFHPHLNFSVAARLDFPLPTPSEIPGSAEKNQVVYQVISLSPHF